MYHSYAIQVHGYVTQTSNSDDDPFILVHGVSFFILFLLIKGRRPFHTMKLISYVHGVSAFTELRELSFLS